jgi:hypothetical protein
MVRGDWGDNRAREQNRRANVLGRHVRRRLLSSRADPGRIPVPPVEILELDARLDGAIGKPAALQPAKGWLGRLLRGDHANRYLLGPEQIPAAILDGRGEFALLEFDPDGRPVVQVLPGMAGELRIGVSRMTVAQMLADPALERPDGGARLPLPYGARLRIQCGPKTFVARVGGAPLPEAHEPAPRHTQLATA